MQSTFVYLNSHFGYSYHTLNPYEKFYGAMLIVVVLRIFGQDHVNVMNCAGLMRTIYLLPSIVSLAFFYALIQLQHSFNDNDNAAAAAGVDDGDGDDDLELRNVYWEHWTDIPVSPFA